MTRALLLAGLFLVATPVESQIVEVNTRRQDGVRGQSDEPRLQLFGRGLLDVHFSGQVEASGQVVRLRIGESGKFSVPLYLLTGATSSVFGSNVTNESTIASLISPTAGVLNVMANGTLPLWESESGITLLALGGLGSFRFASGQETLSGDTKLFGVAYYDGGLWFQTGAWEEGESYQEGGVFWLQLRYAGSIAPEDDLVALFGEAGEENASGLRFETGILIRDRVNVKVGGFFTLTGKDLPTLDEGVWRLALDYKVE